MVAISVPFFFTFLILNITLRIYEKNNYYDRMRTNTTVLETDILTQLDQYEILLKQMTYGIDSINSEQEFIQNRIIQTQKNYPQIERIDILDKNKIVLITAPYRSDMIGLDDSVLLKDLDNTHIYWSDVFLSRITGKASVFAAIETEQYTIVCYISISEFQDILNKYQIMDMNTDLSSSTGLLVATSSSNIIVSKELIKQEDRIEYYRTKDELSNKGIQSFYEISENGWVIELTALDSTIFKTVDLINKLLAITYIITFTFVFWSITRTINKLTAPIAHLTRSTQLVGEGNYDIEVDYSYKELNDLAENFGLMAGKIKRRSDELNQFVYIASHDLQEPLRMITSYIQILDRKYNHLFDEDGKKYFNYVVDGASRMKNLIRDLLRYSRAGNKYVYMVVDLNELLRDVQYNLEVSVKENSGLIEVPTMPTIVADRTMIQQVFQNIISNSLKYHSDQAPHIVIEWSEDKLFWEFRIYDNGIGIDEAYKDKIFEVFSRLNTKDKYDGTGIGLAVCKKVVENHGGIIRVLSPHSTGSQFIFTIRKGLEN